MLGLGLGLGLGSGFGLGLGLYRARVRLGTTIYNYMNYIEQEVILFPAFLELHKYHASFIWHAEEVGTIKV